MDNRKVLPMFHLRDRYVQSLSFTNVSLKRKAWEIVIFYHFSPKRKVWTIVKFYQ